MPNYPRIVFDCHLTDVQQAKIEKQLDTGEWCVYDDIAADKMCYSHIVSNLWTFLPSFLAKCTQLPICIFELLAALNDQDRHQQAITALIMATCGLQTVVDEAIRVDGRGHYLSSYDSNEVKIEFGKKVVYAYRCG
jgi:hypothetical protein